MCNLNDRKILENTSYLYLIVHGIIGRCKGSIYWMLKNQQLLTLRVVEGTDYGHYIKLDDG